MGNRILVVPCVVLHNDEGRVLVLKRSNGKRYAGKWEFPGGSLRFGEKPREAALRELREETGFDLNSSDLMPVDTFGFVYGNRRQGVQFIIPLYASNVNGEPVLKPDEHEDWSWMNLKQIEELEDNGSVLRGVYEMALQAVEKLREIRGSTR